MPTLSADTQAVLATDKVRFQGQEVAFVVADDHYAARDALELIDVEYEPLPVRRRPAQGARRRRAGHPRRQGGQDRQPHLRLGGGRRGGDRRACSTTPTSCVVTQEIPFQRVHPCPLETCGAVADYDAVTGKLRLWCTTQAPHAHRTLYALVAGLPEHKIQVIAPDIGGGFGNKVPIYPGYVCAVVGLDRHRQAGEVDGGPDGEPHLDRLRPRLPDAGPDRGRPRRAHPRAARRRARRPRRVQRDRAADEVPGRVLPHLHRLLRPRGGVLHGQGRLHEQGARRRRLPLLVPRDRGGLPGRADGRPAGRRARDGPGRAADEELHPARAVPVHDQDRLDLRLRRLPGDDARGDADRRLRRPAARAGREARARRATWASASRSSPRPSAPGRARTWTSPGSAWPTAPSCACTRPARPCCGISVKTQGQGHETTFAQIVAEELGIPPEDVEVVHGDTDQTPFGLGTYGSRSTPVSGAATAMVARKIRDKARLIAAAALEVSPGRPRVGEGPLVRQGRPREGPDDPGAGARLARRRSSCPRASRATSTRSRSTTRPTSPIPTAPTSAWSTSTRARARSSCGASSPSTTAACASTR